MKSSADLGGGYPPRPSASVDNTLLDLQNSLYPTQPHSIIAKYSPIFKTARVAEKIWRLINTIASIWGENMLGYLSLDIICSLYLTVFLELRSRKTVLFSEQIMSADKYPSIFSCQMEATVCNGNRISCRPIQSVTIRVITKSDDPAVGVRFVYHEYDYRLNWTTRNPIIN